MTLGQKAIGRPAAKDLYDGFGKEIFQQSQARLEECYKILENSPYNSARFKFRLWRNAVRYVEGKISRDEFQHTISKFL